MFVWERVMEWFDTAAPAASNVTPRPSSRESVSVRQLDCAACCRKRLSVAAYMEPLIIKLSG